jgi:hypothetical protein
MAQLLVNVLEVALGAGDSVTLDHGLVSNGVSVSPTQVFPNRASSIVVESADATAVTFRNDGADSATAFFRCEYDYSAIAVGAAPMLWQGAAAAPAPAQAINISMNGMNSSPVTLAAGVETTIITAAAFTPSVNEQVFNIFTGSMQNASGASDTVPVIARFYDNGTLVEELPLTATDGQVTPLTFQTPALGASAAVARTYTVTLETSSADVTVGFSLLRIDRLS